MPDYIHKENIGTAFQLTIWDEAGLVDISSASVMEVTFEKPSGAKVVQTGSHATDGTDGVMQYVTLPGDLDEAGVWKLQGKVAIGGGTFYTEIHDFRVYDNL